MAFKIFTAGPLSSADMNTYVMQQANITCTSTTRPAAPVDGMEIFETDTRRKLRWDGLAWRRTKSESWDFPRTGGSPSDSYAAADLFADLAVATLPAADSQPGDFEVIATGMLAATAVTGGNIRLIAGSPGDSPVLRAQLIPDPLCGLDTIFRPYTVFGLLKGWAAAPDGTNRPLEVRLQHQLQSTSTASATISRAGTHIMVTRK